VRLFGAKSADELLGQSIMDRFHPADHALILERIRKLNEEGEAAPLMERQYVKLDGSAVDVEASAVPFTHQNKKGALVFVRDITKRKQAEEELKKHRDRLEELVKERTDELSKANELLKQENDVRKTTEAALRSRERELEGRRRELEEINSALKVLLRQREEDKKNIELNIISNIKISVMPYLEKMESSCSKGNQTELAIMKSHLNKIASPFIRKISSEYLGFTPNEIRIASLIKEGKSSKEIAEILNVSLNTIMTHRYNIRKKTRLKNKKVNLRSYLQTLE
jgi:PAS domain S-box-containing protein